MQPTVIMVHGAFCGGWAFETFKAPFEAAGYQCLTPDLPGHGQGERTYVAGQSMSDYARAIIDLVRDCEAPPILVGHSMGGLVSLMAASRVEVAALVLLAPSSPWGVTTAAMEDAATALGLIGLNAYWAQPVDPDWGLFNAYSADRLPRDLRHATFAKMTPESGRALSETLNWWFDPFLTTSVTPSNITCPVLTLVGAQDRIHPPGQVRDAVARFGADLRILPGMGHWLLEEPGWADVAQAALTWLDGPAVAAA